MNVSFANFIMSSTKKQKQEKTKLLDKTRVPAWIDACKSSHLRVNSDWVKAWSWHTLDLLLNRNQSDFSRRTHSPVTFRKVGRLTNIDEESKPVSKDYPLASSNKIQSLWAQLGLSEWTKV